MLKRGVFYIVSHIEPFNNFIVSPIEPFSYFKVSPIEPFNYHKEVSLTLSPFFESLMMAHYWPK